MACDNGLYTGPGVKNPERVLARLRAGAGTVGIQTIVWTGTRLEIIPSVFWKFAFIRETGRIVGLAQNREEALGLLCEMAQDCTRSGKDLSFRSFFGACPEASEPTGEGKG